ncbi:MAG: TonB-dependent receptor plug domain-containing protein [Candidatus Marinimicrobia bacterium]|nr:TonB-dependent receptor plug domain-containing protein [Candidatus Neomarinimicrobiota bacterium]
MKYLLIILFFSTILISQTKPIQGSIFDEKGDRLFNVNIVSKPSNTGTQSDDKGEFIFEIPIGDRQIILDHIGYEQETLDAILFKNGTSVTLTPKVLELKPLDVTGAGREQFSPFETKNSVIILDTEELAVRGFVDIGDALFSEQSIVMNETMNGQKSISIRASTSEEMIYLYDGIRINTLGDPLLDLSIFSASGLSGIELVKGGHEKALSSSGTINFIPKLTYGSSASFTQQFGTYNYGGFDGFGSIGSSLVSLNGGIGEGQFSQFYVDAEKPEITTSHQRQFGHFGIKNGHNLEFRFMGFKNGKQFQNDSTGNSVSVDMENIIGKMIHSSPVGGEIIFFGLFQNNLGSESTNSDTINKEDINNGLGFSFEKPIRSAMVKFNGETNYLSSNWVIDSSAYITKRVNSIFTGSFELVQPERNQGIQLKDVKIVLSKHLISDTPDSSFDEIMDTETWDESSSMFTGSIVSIMSQKRIMLYTNLGNVFRLPSLNERFSNHIRSTNQGTIGLIPEYKNQFEMGIKIENENDNEKPYYAINISGFNYHYSNKIKQIQLTGVPIQFPINYGEASLSGFDSNLSFSSKTKWFNFSSSYAYYLFSDPMAFQLQPDKMVRNKITLKIRWFQLDLIQRSESARQITSINSTGTFLDNRLDAIQTYDANLSLKLKFREYKGTISISGKNLNNESQVLNGISLFDQRYNLNLGLSWK